MKLPKRNTEVLVTLAGTYRKAIVTGEHHKATESFVVKLSDSERDKNPALDGNYWRVRASDLR